LVDALESLRFKDGNQDVGFREWDHQLIRRPVVGTAQANATDKWDTLTVKSQAVADGAELVVCSAARKTSAVPWKPCDCGLSLAGVLDVLSRTPSQARGKVLGGTRGSDESLSGQSHTCQRRSARSGEAEARRLIKEGARVVLGDVRSRRAWSLPQVSVIARASGGSTCRM